MINCAAGAIFNESDVIEIAEAMRERAEQLYAHRSPKSHALAERLMVNRGILIAVAASVGGGAPSGAYLLSIDAGAHLRIGEVVST